MSSTPNTPSRKPLLSQPIPREPPAPPNLSQSSQFLFGSQTSMDPARNGNSADGQAQEVDFEAEAEQAIRETEPNHKANREVQVPATNPANRSEPNRTPETSTHSEPEPRSTPPTEKAEENGVLDLPEFDWDDFHRRYQTELNNITQDEIDLLEEFDRFSEAFALWAQSSTRRDNERAAKRLKTRERYIELAEDSLETKKARYVKVVDAFKTALSLISGR